LGTTTEMEKKRNRRIILNALSAAAQVIVVGLIYFILYHYLVSKLGPSQLGIWALVISTTSIANFANFGITSGLVKFVADFRETHDNESMHRLVFTAFLSIVVFFAILILAGYLGINFILKLVVDAKFIKLALRLLPWSLLCLFLNEAGSIYSSILEGFQRNYVRNIIYIISAVLFLGLSFLWVPRFGMMGVAYAQAIQSLIILISAFFCGSSLINGFTLFKWNWDKIIFKKLIAYGSRFQLVSLFQLLYEPGTKLLLSHFGGLAAVGYYEMASRLVNQVRALIVSANQVMIPVVAQASFKGTEEVRKLYLRTMSATLFVNAPLICGLITFSAFISLFWIGHVEPAFMFPLLVLSITMFFNVMCGPAYYSSLGQGKLGLLVYIHLFMAFFNLSLGLLLGHFLSSNGVILSWGITFTTGSLLLIIFFQRNMLISFARLFSQSDILLISIAAAFALVAVLLSQNFSYSKHRLVLTLVSFGVVFVPLLLSNHNLKRLTRR